MFTNEVLKNMEREISSKWGFLLILLVAMAPACAPTIEEEDTSGDRAATTGSTESDDDDDDDDSGDDDDDDSDDDDDDSSDDDSTTESSDDESTEDSSDDEYTLTVGEFFYDSTKIYADQDPYMSGGSTSGFTGYENADCPEGYFVYAIEAQDSLWGTYPAITKINLYCQLASDPAVTDVVEIGTDHGSSESSDTCIEDGQYITGLRVLHDRYIKDFILGCGDITIDEDAGSVSVSNQEFKGTFSDGTESLFGRYESNDDDTDAECDGDSLVTGLRYQYRYDSNEAAFTYVRLRCGTLALE